MKTFLASAGLALGLGLLAAAPASAAPIVKSTVTATAVTADAQCRTVEKRVRRNGVTRITRTRECSDYGRPRYSERRVYRERTYGYGPRRVYRDRGYYSRPGLSIRVN